LVWRNGRIVGYLGLSGTASIQRQSGAIRNTTHPAGLERALSMRDRAVRSCHRIWQGVRCHPGRKEPSSVSIHRSYAAGRGLRSKPITHSAHRPQQFRHFPNLKTRIIEHRNVAVTYSPGSSAWSRLAIVVRSRTVVALVMVLASIVG
jgi:hypothetical protein